MKEKVDSSKKWVYIAIFLAVSLLIVLGIFFQKEIIRGTNVTSNDCGEGTIILDADKSLCWQKSTSELVDSWEAASNYCDSLNLSAKQDWRLPTIQELAQLVDTTRSEMKILEDFVNLTKKNNYWSSSEYNNNPQMHWYIAYSTAYQGFGYNFNKGYAVRCIRNEKIV